MMTFQYFLLGSFLLAAMASAGDLKIDFSCQKEMVEDQWKNIKEECRMKMGNPIKRPCVEACILSDLGLLRRAFNASRLNRQNMDGLGSTFVMIELEALMSDNLDLAEAIQEKVEDKCGALMEKVVQGEKKTCEEWNEIYKCVQGAFCEAQIVPIAEMFPDLRCHPGYKRGPAREDHLQCMKDIKDPFNKGCYKLCMMNRFGMFEYKVAGGVEPVAKLGDIGNEDEGYYGALVGELQWRMKGNDELSIKIAKGIHEKCKTFFDKLVIEEKKPCEEWDPLYDCIKDVVSCK